MRGEVKTKPEWIIFANKEEIQTLMRGLTDANYHLEDLIKDKKMPPDVVKSHKETIEKNNKLFKELSEVMKQ